MSKETYYKETYYSVKRDLLQCQKRPITKRPITVSKETYYKETYYSVKRDLLQCQKRPITKRPITVSKETYYSVKRDLLQYTILITCAWMLICKVLPKKVKKKCFGVPGCSFVYGSESVCVCTHVCLHVFSCFS